MKNNNKTSNISPTTINGIINYVKILNDINVDYLKLVSLSCIDNRTEFKEIYFDICSKINIIINTNINYGIKNVDDIKRFNLNKKNEGINRYKKDFKYLGDSISTIFNENMLVLYSMKRLRNKIEHDFDAITIVGMSSGCCVCEFKFEIDGYIININSNDIKKLIIDLNELFNNMLKDIDVYIAKVDKDNYYHTYFEGLRKYKFDKYNEVISSKLLFDISIIINNI